jgi:uncharacterized protein YcbX
MAQLSIAALVVYPLKSAAGCSVAEAAFTPTGLAFDRTWAAVRAGTGRFISQRVHPKMALISARLSAPELLAGADAEADAALILTAPGAGELRVPLAPAGARALVEASVWGWKGLAADEGDAAAAWLSAFLGVDARLVHYVGVAAGGTADARARRAVKSEFVPAAAAGEVAFADSFPLLVATHASLDALNAEIGGGAALPINRFRPNVLVAGAAPWEEDSWVRLALGGAGGAEGGGGVILEFGQPCGESSCVLGRPVEAGTIPETNQQTNHAIITVHCPK